MKLVAKIPLRRENLGPTDRLVLESGTLSASLFAYDSGIEALRLTNARGELIVLPWFGQMIWSARFDGVDLAMRSHFATPVPSTTIAGTYGCLAFHSGLLRNGVPAAGDDHAAHGEFPCAAMQHAWLELLDDDGARCLRVTSEREHIVGFGPHYLARPSVTLRENDAMFDIALDVENRSGRAMELMYMCHVNFAPVPNGRIVQPAPFSPESVTVRRAVPAHVEPNPAYLAFIDTLSADPARMEILDEPALYDPEQVFYLKNLATDAAGNTQLMLQHPAGDAFCLAYAPSQLPHCVRWILDGPDAGVAAFALPATCEPEGYTAEKRKANIRLLAPREHADFAVRIGHLDKPEAAAMAARIAALTQPPGEPA